MQLVNNDSRSLLVVTSHRNNTSISNTLVFNGQINFRISSHSIWLSYIAVLIKSSTVEWAHFSDPLLHGCNVIVSICLIRNRISKFWISPETKFWPWSVKMRFGDPYAPSWTSFYSNYRLNVSHRTKKFQCQVFLFQNNMSLLIHACLDALRVSLSL